MKPINIFSAAGDIVSAPAEINPQKVFPNSSHAEMITASNLVHGQPRNMIEVPGKSHKVAQPFQDKIGHILPHWRSGEIARVAMYRLGKITPRTG